MMKVTSRRKAIEQGLPRYFTGKPCKHGHISERHTGCKQCIECKRAYFKTALGARNAANRAMRRQYGITIEEYEQLLIAFSTWVFRVHDSRSV